MEWLNRDVPIRLDDDNVAEYVRIRTHFQAGVGRLHVVDGVEALRPWVGDSNVDRHAALIRPVESSPRNGGGWTVAATAVVDGRLVRAHVPVEPDGSLGRIDVDLLSDLELDHDYPAIGVDGEPTPPDVRARLERLHGRWDALDPVDADAVRHDFPLELGAPAGAVPLRRALACYPGWDLVRMPHTMLAKFAFALHRPGKVLVSTRGAGHSLMVRFNPSGLLIDTEAQAEAYLRFFAWFIGTPEHGWLLLDDPAHVPLAEGASIDPGTWEGRWVAPHAVPLRDEDPEDARWRFRATLLSGTKLISAEFRIDEAGGVEMTDDEDLSEELEVDAELLGRMAELPPLGPRFRMADGVPRELPPARESG
jgi:hypothetical protein